MKEEVIKGIIRILVYIGVFLLAALFGQLLWNYILPDLLGVGEITYWEFLGLEVLCGLLFNRINISFPKK